MLRRQETLPYPSPAQSIGMGDKVGTLEIGKEADILIVEGNPLKDIMNLSKVKAVFKAGERVC